MDTDALLSRLADDPWTLDLPERQALLERHRAAQDHWLPRLRELVEPPRPGTDFPAFLLAVPPFARLGRAVGDARRPGELSVGTADELQRFTDTYRSWLFERGEADPSLHGDPAHGNLPG